jgi:calcineurin-like phosphoesterase family protein
MTPDFYTSDLHFGHTDVIQYSSRPFSNVAEMNDALMKNYRVRVARLK